MFAGAIPWRFGGVWGECGGGGIVGDGVDESL